MNTSLRDRREFNARRFAQRTCQRVGTASNVLLMQLAVEEVLNNVNMRSEANRRDFGGILERMVVG